MIISKSKINFCFPFLWCYHPISTLCLLKQNDLKLTFIFSFLLLYLNNILKWRVNYFRHKLFNKILTYNIRFQKKSRSHIQNTESVFCAYQKNEISTSCNSISFYHILRHTRVGHLVPCHCSYNNPRSQLLVILGSDNITAVVAPGNVLCLGI